jgi:hypothetical protein
LLMIVRAVHNIVVDDSCGKALMMTVGKSIEDDRGNKH